MAHSQPEPPPLPCVVADPYTTRLLAGGSDRCWGLNLNLSSPPPLCLREPYAALTARLRAGLADAPDVYLYPFDFLHITCAAPAPFTKCAIAPEERALLVSAWSRALAAAAASGELPRAPFPLVYGKPTLGAAAAIFPVDDPTGGVAICRSAIARCYEASVEVLGLPTGLRERCRFSMPNIIHSTFLRFGSNGVPRSAQEVAALHASFQEAADTWEPITVWADALRLVEECAVYMHLDLAGADAGLIALTLPFEVARASAREGA